MASTIDNENFRNTFAILADAQTKQSDLFRKEAWRLIVKLNDPTGMELKDSYQAMIEIGKLGQALMSLDDIKTANTIFFKRDPVRV